MIGKSVVVTHALRTPIGKFLGAFCDVPARDLGVTAVRGVLDGAGLDPARVDLVVFGNARQAGSGPNLARQIAFGAGVPKERPAYTVNQACSSGLLSIFLAAESIMLGRSEVAIAGGTESMSRVPYLLDRARTGYRLGDAALIDGQYRDGFFCLLSGMLMGRTAENLAERYDIPREEQDRYAVESQRRCERTVDAGGFRDEIVPVDVPGRKGKTTRIEADEHPRRGVTIESLSRLEPVFKDDGTVHAGNSSGITDGAAALILMSEETASSLGHSPMARLGEYATVGVDPAYMGIGPVDAIRALEARSKKKIAEYDLVELNEAFAAQVLACDRELRFDRDRLNVNGGAISLGHPIGCSGARIVVTLLHEMGRRDAKAGIATLCVSGGLGAAAEFLR